MQPSRASTFSPDKAAISTLAAEITGPARSTALMELAERIVDDVTVVDLGGTLTADDVTLIRERLTGILERGTRFVVFNLANLRYLDSSGLGELVGFQLRAIKAGVVVKIANPDLRIQDLLLMTNLVTVFESHDSVAMAVESFHHT